MASQDNTSRVDYGLVLILMLMALVSCISIYSAQSSGQYDENFVLKQMIWYLVGSGIIALVLRFDSEQLKKLSWFAYGFGLFLLILLIIAPESIAPVKNGAKNWFIVPGLGSLQPSEFVKVFLILGLAKTIHHHHLKFHLKTIGSDFWLLIKLGIVTLFPLALIIKQDLGTSLVFISILLGMIFVSGITWKLLLPIFGGFGVFASAIFSLVIWYPKVLETYLGVQQYKFDRIYSWLDPYNFQSSTGFQLTRSLLAIGSGQTTGKGFGNREIYLPENHTDFIFSVIGEEFGFLGASIVLSLFFVLVYYLTKIALETKDQFYSYICAGVISMITFHVFQNIGMTIGVLPITGIPLPFISYGGSSLMGNMLAMGLIFSIRFHYKKFMFSTEN